MHTAVLRHAYSCTTACIQLYYGMHTAVLRHAYSCTTACIQLHYGMHTTVLRHAYSCTTACIQLHYGMHTTVLRHAYSCTTACIQLYYSVIKPAVLYRAHAMPVYSINQAVLQHSIVHRAVLQCTYYSVYILCVPLYYRTYIQLPRCTATYVFICTIAHASRYTTLCIHTPCSCTNAHTDSCIVPIYVVPSDNYFAITLRTSTLSCVFLGWVTIGPALSGTTFNPRIYASYFEKEDALLLPFDERIEELRPKSPPPKAGGRGRGGGGQTMQSAPPPGVVQTKHLVFPR